MVNTTNIKVSREQRIIISHTKEASEVYDLWYPRPELGETVDNSPELAERVLSLRKHKYRLSELRLWFRLDGLIHANIDSVNKKNPRGKTRRKSSLEAWEDIKACYGFRCAYCEKKSRRLTKDHVNAVSHKGADSMTNIVPACPSCNSSKSSRRLQDWPRFRKLQLHLLGS